MRVEFLAHAGIWIETRDGKVAVDPWFYGSTFEEPLLHGVLPPNKTIDFQLPNIVKSVRDYRPHFILFSHFHTHHAPAREIKEFLKQSHHPIEFLIPNISEEDLGKIENGLSEFKDKVKIKRMKHGEFISRGDLVIKAVPHPHVGHNAWFVGEKTASALHIADAPINPVWHDRRMSPLWLGYKNLQPTLFFCGSGGHTLKSTNEGVKVLAESLTMSPIESARLAAIIKPKVAAVIGFYNHSMWKNQTEFILPAGVVEEMFQWGLNHLDPEIKSVKLIPHMSFDIDSDHYDPKPTIQLL